jgi:aryl-alcohol dehydrogenase-like predicted oxidoreductase
MAVRKKIIGAWFKKSGKRKDVVLATKVAGPGPAMTWIRGGEARVDRKQVALALEGSLKRLQTDYVDLYQIHWPQRPVNSFGKLGFEEAAVGGDEKEMLLEALEAARDLVKQGKIRHFGLSNETAWGVMTFLRHHRAHRDLPRVVSIQNPYNLLNRSFEVGLSEIALQEHVGLLAYAPLAAGVLTGKYLDGKIPKGSRWDIDSRASRYKKPRTDEAVHAYLGVASRYGLDPARMAIAFVKAQPFVTAAIIGATSMAQLKNDIAAAELALPAEALRDINGVHALISNPCP